MGQGQMEVFGFGFRVGFKNMNLKRVQGGGWFTDPRPDNKLDIYIINLYLIFQQIDIEHHYLITLS